MVAIVALALLDGVALYALSRSSPQLVAAADGAQTRAISVTGTGYAYASPDIAYISVTVLTQSATAVEAQQKNTDTMNNVIGALKAIGVIESDLQTDQYNLRPIYDSDRQPKIVAYECTQTLRVTWKKVREVGVVLDAAVRAGANNVGSITFALSKQKIDALTGDAIKEAVADAESKAQTLAAALKVTIVGKTSASIGTPYTPQDMTLALRTSVPTIIPGELRVVVTVYVNYHFV
ncbi:MAG: SIMPL domain-containing protein [archaeon]